MANPAEAPDLLMYLLPEAHEIADKGNVAIMEDQVGPERVLDLLTTIVELGVNY